MAKGRKDLVPENCKNAAGKNDADITVNCTVLAALIADKKIELEAENYSKYPREKDAQIVDYNDPENWKEGQVLAAVDTYGKGFEPGD